MTAGTGPRVLVVTLFAPEAEPRHAGGEFLRRHLAALHGAGIATAVACCPPAQFRPGPPPDGLPVEWLGSDAPPGRLVRLLDRAGQALAGFTPGARAIWSPATRRRLRRLAAEADVVELEWLETAAFVPLLRRIRPGLPIVCVCHDVVHQAWERKAAAGRWPRSAAFHLAARRSRARERRLLALCDEVVVFSEKDRRLLADLGLSGRMRVIDVAVSMPAEPATGVAAADPHLLFTGAMDRRENHEGMLWFLDECWPRVRAAQPDAQLRIVGARPRAELLSRSGSAGVLVTGEVPDLAPYYRAAGGFVAPLLLGAGVKVKVVEALLHGLPVVATPVAAEGIADVCGADAFAAVTADPGAFADAVAGLLQDADRRVAVGQRGRTLAAEHFTGAPSAVLAEDYATLAMVAGSGASAG